MKRTSPRHCDRHVTHISAYKTARILHPLRQTQCAAPVRSSWRETRCAYKTAGILHALRQTRCDQPGAAQR
ncbi:unnamed protein product, partial [Bemisia tabaci]